MARVRWTPERVEWLRAYAPGHSWREIAAEHKRVYGIELTRGQVKSAKAAYGAKSGTVGGQFEPGHTSWNKGMTWDEFMSAEGQRRCRATQFKPGIMPHNGADVPVGAERTDTDGYTWVKVAERPSRKDCNDNWVAKQRLVWEQEHGESVPDGCMVVFLDHDRTNFAPDNLALETKAEHAVIARWGIGYCDAETHEVARAIARVKSAKYAARQRVKGA